jgi:hypothetical protein
MARDGTLAFVVPTDSANKSLWAGMPLIKTEYNADQALMTVSVNVTETTQGYRRAEPYSASIIWDQSDAPTIHYRASNAFGAVADVSALTHTRYGLAFGVLSPWNGVNMTHPGPMAYPLMVKFGLTSARAQEVSKRLRVLVLCSAIPHSPVSTSASVFSETDDGLVSSHTTYKFLHVWLSEVWVFDSETGEVLAKSVDALPPVGPKREAISQPMDSTPSQ